MPREILFRSQNATTDDLKLIISIQNQICFLHFLLILLRVCPPIRRRGLSFSCSSRPMRCPFRKPGTIFHPCHCKHLSSWLMPLTPHLIFIPNLSDDWLFPFRSCTRCEHIRFSICKNMTSMHSPLWTIPSPGLEAYAFSE